MPTRTSYEPGTPSWVDLASPDLAASVAFYSSLFGWEAMDQGPEAGHYHMFELRAACRWPGRRPIMMEGQPPAWTTYISVERCRRQPSPRSRRPGASVFVEPMDVLDVGRMAVFADPTGAAAAVWQPRQHLGAGLVNEPGALVWNELTTRDIDGGQALLRRGVRLGGRDRRHGRHGVHHVEAGREGHRRHDGPCRTRCRPRCRPTGWPTSGRRTATPPWPRPPASGPPWSPVRWTSPPAGSPSWPTRSAPCSVSSPWPCARLTTRLTPTVTVGPIRPVGTSLIKQQRRLVTELPGPKSRALDARRAAAVAAGVSSVLPLYVEEASGAILVDVDGNSLIDLGPGIAVVSVGHAAPAVVDAVRDQVGRFTHTCFMVNPYESYVAVCEALNALAPGDTPKRSALFNSGAEAVENAVKVARHVTGRQAVVVFDHAYHGRTNLTMALTAKNMPYRDKFGPFAPEVYRVPDVLSVPRPRRDDRRGGRRPGHRADRAPGGRGQRGLCADRAHPGRGRVRRTRPGVPARPWPTGASGAGCCWRPTRSRPGSAGPGTGSPATTRASSPT